MQATQDERRGVLTYKVQTKKLTRPSSGWASNLPGGKSMKKIFSVAVILVLLIFAAMVVAKPAPPVMAHCPRIHAAQRALDDAMKEMDAAGHDFCGHKADAQEATRRAMEQLKRAEECDKCR
jgi:hypothetical protein